MSRPSNTILPALGSSSRVISRPVVVLPQPDSPTRPSVSPARTARSIPSTARTAPMRRLKMMPRVIGKCFCNPVTSSRFSLTKRLLGSQVGLDLFVEDPAPHRGRQVAGHLVAVADQLRYLRRG